MASQACIIHYDSIRTCDNLMKARQKTFHTPHTFAEYKTEEGAVHFRTVEVTLIILSRNVYDLQEERFEVEA